ncbi:MAG: DUF2218 domain-containing protein [Proteobacteria bacterium]|nr:DUF2218 domain-containing protein [Pseudomonadota bacterium]
MPTTRASVSTEHASRYLQQLSKHWSHKFPVSFDATQARIELTDQRVLLMTADADRLDVTATAPDEASLARFQIVIEEHIRRFAFKETLEFVWKA